MSLSEFAIRRSVTIYIACAVAVLLGAISLQRLPVDLMPDIEFPRISVMTRYSGVAPEEIETLITRRVEEALGAAPGVEEITSNSSEGQSRVFISFQWGTNLDEAANELRTRLDRIRNSLPDDSDPPQLFKFDLSQTPIMFLAVSGNMGPRELRHLAEDQIQYRLERVPGVGQVNVGGGLRREIHVNLSLDKLQALNVPVNEVVNLLRRENTNLPVGPIDEGSFEVLLRTQGEFQSLEQIQNLVLTTRRGTAVYLRDVADVEDGSEDERQMIRIDGQPAVRMQIQKQSGGNTVDVARGIRAEIERINRDYPQVRVWALSDNSVFIERSIGTVRSHVLMGAVLAMLVLLLFLRNVRSTMIVSVAIPISLVTTFALLYFGGFTLNTVSLGGLALGVGRLVDDAIVVLENTFRHREAGKSRKEAAIIGSAEVRNAIIASTLTTIAVFLPIAFLSGLASVVFKQLVFTVAFALMCSLLVALTLIPMLASKFLRVEPPSERHPLLRHIVEGSGNLLNRMDLAYQGAIAWALLHRKAILLGGLASFVGTFFLLSSIGVELMPQTDEGQVRLSAELPPGTQLARSDAVARRAEEILRREVPEIENVLVEVGGGGFGGPGGGGGGGGRAEFTLRLVERARRQRSTQEIATALNQRFDNLEAGVRFRARATGGMFFPGMQQGGGERASVEIRGYDLQQASDIAKHVKDLMEGVPGVTDARISRQDGQPEMLIRVDRVKAATLGLNVNALGTVMGAAVGGEQAGFFRQEGDQYNILVRLREADRKRMENVNLIPVGTPAGRTIPAGDFITMQRQEGPVSIERKDRDRNITVSANFAERDLGSVMQDIRERVEPLRATLPPDFSILFGGEYEEQQKAFRELMFALILAVVLVYMVMAAQYESWRDPFIILFSIPLAGLGVAVTLLVTRTNFSIQAFLGVIMLTGIAVSNAILLVDYANLLRRRDGLSVFEAVTLSGRRRLRPILMTTLTTVLGLMPMAFGIGEGGEVQAPMARVVIGGLLTSTAITLLFIPTLYAIAEERSERRAAEARLAPAREPSVAGAD